MLISIIIPVAKSQFLVKAIESIINQTYINWELIIIDDLIDKNVKPIISQFLDSEKIKYYCPNENLGLMDPTQTWNYGVQMAKGRFSVLLGDDDFLSNNYLEKMVELAIKIPKSKIFRAKLAIIDKDDQILEYGMSLPEFEKWDELMYFRNVFGRMHSTSEIMFDLNELKLIGGFVSFPYAWASDDATWLTLTSKFGICSTNETYAFFRRHSNSLSNNLDISQINKIEEEFIKWCIQFIETNYDSTNLTISKKHLVESFNHRSKMINEHKGLRMSQLIKSELKRRIKRVISDLRIYHFN